MLNFCCLETGVMTLAVAGSQSPYWPDRHTTVLSTAKYVDANDFKYATSIITMHDTISDTSLQLKRVSTPKVKQFLIVKVTRVS